MKVIKNKFIPFKGYSYINLFGVLFSRKGTNITDVQYNHEKIHLKQMQELLWVGFYLLYGIEYLYVRLFNKKHNNAYRDISFEEEAYNNQTDMDYCKTRKHYSWFKYLKPNSNNVGKI